MPEVRAGENVARLSRGLSYLYCGPFISSLRQEEGRRLGFGHRLEIRACVKEEG